MPISESCPNGGAGPATPRVRHPTILLALASLAACSQPADRPPAETIPCALDGAGEFIACEVESDTVPGGTIMVIRHPDGGFRRLEIEGDMVRAADGAETLRVTPAADATEVTLGNDRYRLAPPAPPVNAAP